jgi:hypothetical protein
MEIRMLGEGGERVASGKGQRFCDRMRGQKRPDLGSAGVQLLQRLDSIICPAAGSLGAWD